MYSADVYQLREMLLTVGVSTEELCIHLGCPGILQLLLGTTNIRLKTNTQQKDQSLLHSKHVNIYDASLVLTMQTCATKGSHISLYNAESSFFCL